MGLFDWFKSSKQEDSSQRPTWDPNTINMNQPSSPLAPITERVVAQQPVCLLLATLIYGPI